MASQTDILLNLLPEGSNFYVYSPTFQVQLINNHDQGSALINTVTNLTNDYQFQFTQDVTKSNHYFVYSTNDGLVLSYFFIDDKLINMIKSAWGGDPTKIPQYWFAYFQIAGSNFVLPVSSADAPGSVKVFSFLNKSNIPDVSPISVQLVLTKLVDMRNQIPAQIFDRNEWTYSATTFFDMAFVKTGTWLIRDPQDVTRFARCYLKSQPSDKLVQFSWDNNLSAYDWDITQPSPPSGVKCTESQIFINGTCQTCPAGSAPNDQNFRCVPKCSGNSALINNSCQDCGTAAKPTKDGKACQTICSGPYVRSDTDPLLCMSCPDGLVPDKKNEKCIKPPSSTLFYLIVLGVMIAIALAFKVEPKSIVVFGGLLVLLWLTIVMFQLVSAATGAVFNLFSSIGSGFSSLINAINPLNLIK
jgi:hypothetical protein